MLDRPALRLQPKQALRNPFGHDSTSSSGDSALEGLRFSATHAGAQSRARRKMLNADSDDTLRWRRRASEMIVQVPIEQLRRIGATDEINSLSRETQHFVGITTIHGPLRIYRGKGIFRLLWTVGVILSTSFFFWQMGVLLSQYTSKPTASQVSFLLPEHGMHMPVVTVCNYNPIRKSYVDNLNKTTGGKFSRKLLEYLAVSYLEVQLVLSVAKGVNLTEGDDLLTEFASSVEPGFNVNGFFTSAGGGCEQTLIICTFGGREFDCCKYAQPILTDMGLCFRLELSKAEEPFLRSQVQSGVNNGLQIVADYHGEEQISSDLTDDDGNDSRATENGQSTILRLLGGLLGNQKFATVVDGYFSQAFEIGFRFYVHAASEVPFLSSEGITVSPGTRVYSAISPNRFVLLPEESWGNCSTTWPSSITGQNTYSSVKCKALCRARYYMDLCGCSPFVYNIDSVFPVCSAAQVYACVRNKVLTDGGNASELHAPVPACTECKLECDRWVYHTYNSYGEGFSQGALDWLLKRHPNTTSPHIKANYVTMNIFYRDMAYTQYEQVQSTTFAQVMSNIGGNMGMTLGMSFISLIELAVYLWKSFWIFVSRDRRRHLVKKKADERQKEEALQHTLDRVKHDSEHESPRPLRRLANSIRRKVTQVWPSSPATHPSPPSQDSFLEANLHGTGRANLGNFVQLSVNPEQLLKLLREDGNRRRSHSCPRPDSMPWMTPIVGLARAPLEQKLSLDIPSSDSISTVSSLVTPPLPSEEPRKEDRYADGPPTFY